MAGARFSTAPPPCYGSRLRQQKDRTRGRLMRTTNRTQQTRSPRGRASKTELERVMQAYVSALKETGRPLAEVMSVFIAPWLLAHADDVRRCGEHSGVPHCCTDYFLNVVLPDVVQGGVLPSDECRYARCPTCRK